MQTLQTWCRLCRLGAPKPLFDPFWRARRTNTIGLIAPKLCRPRDLAQNHRIPKGRIHSRQWARAMAPQKWHLQKAPLKVPIWRACRSKTRPPDAPKLGKLWDRTGNERYLKFECCAYFLAPTSSPQKTSAERRSWSKSHVNWQKPDVTEVVPPPPDHAGWLSIRLGERAAPLAGPQDRPIDHVGYPAKISCKDILKDFITG